MGTVIRRRTKDKPNEDVACRESERWRYGASLAVARVAEGRRDRSLAGWQGAAW